MDDRPETDHQQRLRPAARLGEHERGGEKRRDERAEEGHDRDQSGEDPEGEPVRHVEEPESEGGQRGERDHREELRDRPGAERLREFRDDLARRLALPRRDDTERKVAIELRADGEVDRHHQHGHEVDHQMERREEPRDELADETLGLGERDREDAVLARRHIGVHPGDAHQYQLQATLPFHDQGREDPDDLAGLFDDRRDEKEPHPDQRGDATGDRQREGGAPRHPRARHDLIGDRAEIDRDQQPKEEQEQQVGDRAGEPEEEDSDDDRGEARDDPDPSSQDVVHFGFLSSTSAFTTSSPAPIRLGGAAVPEPSNPIFCLSAVSC